MDRLEIPCNGLTNRNGMETRSITSGPSTRSTNSPITTTTTVPETHWNYILGGATPDPSKTHSEIFSADNDKLERQKKRKFQEPSLLALEREIECVCVYVCVHVVSLQKKDIERNIDFLKLSSNSPTNTTNKGTNGNDVV